MSDPTTAPPALEVRALSHSFKNTRALRNVTFDVEAGTIHGFVGPNGAGKTTTLKIIATLLDFKRGTVRVFGDDVTERTFKVRRAIGYMPDHLGMYRQMTVFEYLDFFAAAYGMSVEKRSRVIDEVLQLTDMHVRRNDLIKGLSRGMEQRVSLARVLVHDPKLLLLDEPASGLDPRARIELMEILRELARMGKTVFISSHILSELAELCSEVTVIDRGEVRYSGSMQELLAIGGDLRVYDLTLAAGDGRPLKALEALDGVKEVRTGGDRQLRVTFDPGAAGTSAILRAVLDAGGEVTEFRPARRNLDQAFFDLTEPGVPEGDITKETSRRRHHG